MKIPSLLRKSSTTINITGNGIPADALIASPAAYTPIARPAWLTEVAYDELQRLRAIGIADGNEHLTLVRAGAIVDHFDGSPEVVSVPTGKTRYGDLILHNHPNCLNALSDADIFLAATRDSTIMCITEDGSIYSSYSLVPVRELTVAYDLAALTASEILNNALAPFNIGRADAADARINAAHFTNTVLGRTRFIEYNFALAPETTAIVSEVSKSVPPPPGGTYLE